MGHEFCDKDRSITSPVKFLRERGVVFFIQYREFYELKFGYANLVFAVGDGVYR